MSDIRDEVDVCIVGAGHAGCEAALACARNGLETVMFTVSVDSIALMPCNPNIGGSSKGHLVRELDALGGEMGKNIDKTFIQSKMLNVSKGPAVHSLRAQADKQRYTAEMRRTLENTEHLTIKQAEVCEILVEEHPFDFQNNKLEVTNVDNINESRSEVVNSNSTEKNELETLNADDIIKSGRKEIDEEISTLYSNSYDIVDVTNNHNVGKSKQRVTGVRIFNGGIYKCKAVVLCTGTYLNARCLCGESILHTGPNGLMAATHLTDSMKSLGIEMQRFKTGTPARMDKRSIDFSKMEEQYGDERVVPFSFSTNPQDVQIDQVSCWLTYTNEKTHEIIKDNLDRSPIYAGIIEGTGPRYCPSIEDKVVKFADKDRHQVFIEPEGLYTNEMYVGGMSSSLPEDVQLAMYRTVPGLEHCKIVRNAYAIEYDCIKPDQLYPTLAFKKIDGLYSGGQLNGSSGYEEAAVQGLIAGINAAKYVKHEEPIVIDRSEGYIGVLIDDLVTKENIEPYRMMTSRSEYRLLLRQDNADLRLRRKGYEAGLVSIEQLNYVIEKEKLIQREFERLHSFKVGANQKIQDFLSAHNSAPLKTGTTMAELMCRPELSYEILAELDDDRPSLSEDVIEQVNINIKYDGYIKRQLKQVEQFKKIEGKKIPDDINYDDVGSLRLEARQKLEKYRPLSVGQASRISGVSPADISVLLIYLESYHYRNESDI